MSCDEAVRRLRARANPANVAGMARYGIGRSPAYRELLKVAR